MTSARATGVLVSCVYLGIKPTVEAVQDHFKDGGRHMYLSALKELEILGFISRKKIRIGSDLRTECAVTESAILYLVGSGFPIPENLTTVADSGVGLSDLLFKQNKLNGYNTLKLESKEYSEDEKPDYQNVYLNLKEKETEMPYEFFQSTVTDDDLGERESTLKRAKERYAAQNVEKQKKGIIHRDSMPKHLWTCSDVAYEFAYRVEFHWNIPPWSVKATDFIKAIGGMRKRLDTDGEVEYEMINLFCEAIEWEKYNSGEHLWKLFIKRADEFANKARATLRSDEELEEAVSQAKKSQEWLYE